MLEPTEFEPDPLFVDSLREAKVILVIWLSCFAWTLIACLTFGYSLPPNPEDFPTVLGIPAWIAWGVALPWMMANIVTVVFCLGYMKDADLGEDPTDETDAAELASARNLAGDGHV